MIKTRFQLLADSNVGQKQYTNYHQVIKAIHKESGFKGFFKGLTASYIGCTEGAIQWICYEKLKSKLLLNSIENNKEISTIEYFIAAAASKTIAILMTYPHEVVRTRLREQSVNGIFKYNGFISTLNTIAKEEGFKGLYRGMYVWIFLWTMNRFV